MWDFLPALRFRTVNLQPPAHPAVFPFGNDAGEPFPVWDTADWLHSWSWRRSFCAGNTSLDAVNVGDVTQQNLVNDLDTAYMWLPMDELSSGPWVGGVNMTALEMLENRALGSYWLMVNTTPVADWASRITMNLTVSGTMTGLSKFPYLR